MIWLAYLLNLFVWSVKNCDQSEKKKTNARVFGHHPCVVAPPLSNISTLVAALFTIRRLASSVGHLPRRINVAAANVCTMAGSLSQLGPSSVFEQRYSILKKLGEGGVGAPPAPSAD